MFIPKFFRITHLFPEPGGKKYLVVQFMGPAPKPFHTVAVNTAYYYIMYKKMLLTVVSIFGPI